LFAQENPPVTDPDGESVVVQVNVTSNEFEVNGRGMSMFIEKRNLPAPDAAAEPMHGLTLFLSPHS